MADEKESATRARPFTPPLPPFRGTATAPRPSATPLTPPEAKRGGLFIGTRVPSRSAAVPIAAEVSISDLAPGDETKVFAGEPGSAPALGEDAATSEQVREERDNSLPLETPRAEAIAATEAMPWLFADPGASRPVAVDPEPDADGAVATEPDISAFRAEPEVAVSVAASLAEGQAAAEMEPHDQSGAVRAQRSGNLDPASVFEAVAARIRRGEIDPGDSAGARSEAGVVAGVLAALLRQQDR